MLKLPLVRNSTLLFGKTAESLHVSSKAKMNPRDSLARSEGKQSALQVLTEYLGNKRQQRGSDFLSKYKV